MKNRPGSSSFFIKAACLGGAVMALSSPAKGEWTLNVGYHNPPGADVGVNLLYWGTRWNFEAGLGWIDAKTQTTKDKDTATNDNKKKTNEFSVALAGDLNIKYRLATGSVAPYLQCGMSAGVGASVGAQNNAGAGAGGPFGGFGLMFGHPHFYGYTAYNVWSQTSGQFQAGLGFGL